MKQNITKEQLLELSKRAENRLFGWCGDAGYLQFDQGGFGIPLLSIGQMIEFLGEHNAGDWSIGQKDGYYGVWSGTEYYVDDEYEELVGVLWEAVKEILER